MSKLSNSITNINEIKQILQTKALPPREKDIYEGEYSGSGKISHSKLYGNTKTIGQILGIIKIAKGNDYGDYDGSFEGDGEVVGGGYKVSFKMNTLITSGVFWYSLDDGNTWIDLVTWTTPLENVRQIKFKGIRSTTVTAHLVSSTLGFTIYSKVPQETENYILSFDINDITIQQLVDPT